jgi:hypothetical protein
MISILNHLVWIFFALQALWPTRVIWYVMAIWVLLYGLLLIPNFLTPVGMERLVDGSKNLWLFLFWMSTVLALVTHRRSAIWRRRSHSLYCEQ